MPKYVSIDDPVTRVQPDYIVCETVDSVTREGFTTTSIPGVTSLRHDDEQLTWVRGWHLPDSEEVKAARAAQALDDNKERMERLRLEKSGISTGFGSPFLSPQPGPSPPQPAAFPFDPGGYDGALQQPLDIVTPTTTGPAPVPFPGSTVIVSKTDC